MLHLSQLVKPLVMVMLIRDILNHHSAHHNASSKLPKFINPIPNTCPLYQPKDLTQVVPLTHRIHLTQHQPKYHMHHHQLLIPLQEHRHVETT